MSKLSITPERLAAVVRAIPEDVPFTMLNLLRYRKHAVYQSGLNLPPCSGKEAYFQRYVPAFNEIAMRSEATKSIKPSFIGHVASQVVAPDSEAWDDIALVEYPDVAAFRQIVASAEYEQDAKPHHAAALQDFRLIATLKQS